MCHFLCSVFVLALVSPLCSHAQPRPTEISIGDYRFDPLQGIPPEASRGVPFVEPGPDVEHWRIVQLNRAPDRATQTALKQRFGLELRRFVQGGAYIERMTLRTARDLEAAGLARASVPYHPGLKYSRLIGTSQFVTRERQDVRGLLLRAVLFDSSNIQQAERAIAAVSGARDVRVIDDRRYGGTGLIVFGLDSPNELPAVAAIDGVATIEEVGEIIEDNVQAAMILQSGATGIGHDTIWQEGLTGRGQIVQVVENNPPDFNHCFFRDPTHPIGPSHRKVEANLHPASAEPQPHGTFIAGSVLGDDLSDPGHHPYRGGARSARLVASSAKGLTLTSFLIGLTEAAEHGAFIHTNSWHDQRSMPPNAPTYTRYATDKFSWENEEHLIIGAMANAAVFMSVLGPPGTAKNALGVSASQTEPMNHGEGLPGPFNERRKPDLTAVGCGVQSALTDDTDQCKIGPWVPPCSTSDATAHAAAAATLVRQYYTDGWYPSGTPQMDDRFTPTAALLKATLLNSTQDMTGVPGYPNHLEGWGVITLDRTLYFPDSPRRLGVWDVRNTDEESLVTSYDPDVPNGAEYTVSVTTSAQPLRVTLVWTDEPTNSVGAVTNNLDLQVDSPNSQSFLGNYFVGDVSVTGGDPDEDNNVEQILIKDPPPGPWVIRVIATNVQIGTQGYALVATADLAEESVPDAPTENTIK